MAIAGMTVGVKMPGDAALVLYGRAHRLALGVKLHVLGVFLGDGNQGLVLIKLAAGSASILATMLFRCSQRRASFVAFLDVSAA